MDGCRYVQDTLGRKISLLDSLVIATAYNQLATEHLYVRWLAGCCG
jgi:hypothetical protein